ncbi:MAG: metal-dependent hydrolase [Parasphingopyxis sp.]
MAIAKTPQDLKITPRDRRFGRDEKQERWWFAGDPFSTAFLNALSVTFPRGEAFFIDSVKAFRDGASPKLEREIRAFTMQEVMHSREHVAFNRKIADTGYNLAPLEAAVEEAMQRIKDRPAIVNLAVTMALEHYTALMARIMMRNPGWWQGVEKHWADLWRWHSIEEIEHKGVAYDTWLHATRDWSRWQRWKMKARVMMLITVFFWSNRIKGMLELLRQDGITGARARWGVFRQLFVTPGILRKALPGWIAYFMPGFHPWNHDDRELIALVDSEYEAAKLPPGLVAAE